MFRVYYWFEGQAFRSWPGEIMFALNGFESREAFENWIATDAGRYPNVIYFFTTLDHSTDIFQE